MEKSYYAIIPANVRYDTDLTANAKLLYSEITALTNEKGYCWATNSYFAELYGVSKTSVSKWISQLIDKGYLNSKIIYKEGTKEILNRYLTIVIGGIEEKFNTPIEEKLKENNTLINNTINNTIKKKTDFDEVIESYTKNNDLRKNIYEFIKMRKGIKATITTLGLKKILSKLDKLATNDNDKITILDNSIMNSWKSIYAIKADKNQNTKKTERGFNNFEPRDYDYDDLENKLLGWDK